MLVELISLESAPDDDPGTGQLAMVTTWVARVVIGFRTANAEREVRRLSTALAAFIHQQRWGQPVGTARVVAVEPNDFLPEHDAYVAWSVEWQQEMHFGDSVWTNNGTIPDTVLASWTPEIGPEHEEDYKPIEGLQS